MGVVPLLPSIHFKETCDFLLYSYFSVRVELSKYTINIMDQVERSIIHRTTKSRLEGDSSLLQQEVSRTPPFSFHISSVFFPFLRSAKRYIEGIVSNDGSPRPIASPLQQQEPFLWPSAVIDKTIRIDIAVSIYFDSYQLFIFLIQIICYFVSTIDALLLVIHT
jgi:hypothetical protein